VTEEGTLGWPGRLAIAVLRDDPPRCLAAESDLVLGRVLALELVAATQPGDIEDPVLLDQIRAALTDERWADALVAWMAATGLVVDVYPDEEIWSDESMSRDRVSLEIHVSPIFHAGGAKEGL